MSVECHKCKCELEFCPVDWPWLFDHWVCPKCDSIYTEEDLDVR